MSTLTQPEENGGIVILGLGPGSVGALTMEAWEWLHQIDVLYVRTQYHPTISNLPDHLKINSFDAIYEGQENFEAVYQEIIEVILSLGEQPGGVTYAVPGHPFVAEATCPEIVKRAKHANIPLRIIDGLSFLEPTFSILGIDPFPDLVLIDAMDLSMRQTPGFPPSSPALIAQIYSRAVASDVKLSLMAAYPDEHKVYLVHQAGTEDELVEDLPLYAIDQSPHLGLLSSLFVPPMSGYASFEAFQEIVARLRAPNGCPWDREQTHLSLRPFLLEEAYEALDALDREDAADLQEELGDLLLQIILHAQIATEENEFNIHHVLEGIGSKLVRRHPHVFSDWEVDDVEGVIQNWEAIKAEERNGHEKTSPKGLLDGVPHALPALLQAQEILERVRRVGLENSRVITHTEDIQTILKAANGLESSHEERFFGELLLALVNLSQKKGIDAESALRNELSRFRQIFSRLEDRLGAMGKGFSDLSEAEKSQIWLDCAIIDETSEGE